MVSRIMEFMQALVPVMDFSPPLVMAEYFVLTFYVCTRVSLHISLHSLVQTGMLCNFVEFMQKLTS